MVHAPSRLLNETPSMLEARLELVERIRKVEHAVAHAEQARTARALMRGRAHELGNAVQVVKLSAQELQRRIAELGRPDLDELITDMNAASENATRVLAQMIDATHMAERMQRGAVVTHAVRAAVDLARPAFLTPIELRVDLDDTVHTYCSAEELEAIVLASMLEASHSNHVTFVVRERVIQNKRWVELIRLDDRQTHDGDYAHMFESGSLLKVVAECAKAAGGEASLAPGRGGLELVVELPVAELR
jgi:nitrogen-specific signal transduction histidine kinase